MRRQEVLDKIESMANANLYGHSEKEGAGQHYIEIGLGADDKDAVATELEKFVSGTDWKVYTYDSEDGPIFYDYEQEEDRVADIRVKKNTWNEHKV